MRRNISTNVERMLYAESMGRCMNPECKVELFKESGDIIEKAHIIPYCDTKDNSFENLVILCPNCHTNFDKNGAFNTDDIKIWKKIRRDELNNYFGKKYNSFKQLEDIVVPILLRNKVIFENYYIDDKKKLWNMFEGEILSNNRMLKNILKTNIKLIQNHSKKSYSNVAIIEEFLLHIDEFESTRLSKEKLRHVVFPVGINSLFGIEPLRDKFLPSVESVESLIEVLKNNGEFKTIVLGIDNPYIEIKNVSTSKKIYLNDIPRLRQIYSDNNCFRNYNVRFDSLNYALKYIKSRGLKFEFPDMKNLKEIRVNNLKIVFIYKYCLSKVELLRLSPEINSVVLNLHNWNGDGCISTEAYKLAEQMNIKLLTMRKFYGYINSIK